jgi:hypothetical protein
MSNENPTVRGFQKGHKKVGGRKPGARNILTSDHKRALVSPSPRPLSDSRRALERMGESASRLGINP